MSKDIKFYKNLIYGYYEQLKKEIILNLSNDNRSKNASVEYFMRIKTIKKFNYTNLEKNLDKINLTNDINLILFEKKFIFFIKSPLNKFGQLIQTDKFCTARSRKIIEYLFIFIYFFLFKFYLENMLINGSEQKI